MRLCLGDDGGPVGVGLVGEGVVGVGTVGDGMVGDGVVDGDAGPLITGPPFL